MMVRIKASSSSSTQSYPYKCDGGLGSEWEWGAQQHNQPLSSLLTAAHPNVRAVQFSSVSLPFAIHQTNGIKQNSNSLPHTLIRHHNNNNSLGLLISLKIYHHTYAEVQWCYGWAYGSAMALALLDEWTLSVVMIVMAMAMVYWRRWR